MESTLEAIADLDVKHFSLTHIIHPPTTTGTLLALLSLSPIFLFVSYFTLVIFTRRLTLLLLAGGSVFNEILSLLAKRLLKSPRPFPDLAHVGHGYGMPSSHSQAGAFCVAWGIAYALSLRARYPARKPGRAGVVEQVRVAIYVFGLVAWSVCVAYSRYALKYHSFPQVIAGYALGLAFGAFWYACTEHVPRVYPASIPGRIRAMLEWLWTGIGGVGGWTIGGADGGWGEGWMFGVHDERKAR